MPLSELYRSVNGKNEQKSTDVSYIPNDEFVELIWEKGQILIQGQSSKAKKTPVSSNFQFQTSKIQEKNGLLDVPVMRMNQDDDMVPWLNYPLDDYCTDLLPELSGVTVHEPTMHNGVNVIEKRVNNKDPSSAIGSRNGNLFSFSDPVVRPGVSDIGNSNCRNKIEKVVQKQDSTSTVLNFSHFSRPAAKAMAKANAQNVDPKGVRKEVGQPSSDLVKVGSASKQLDEPHCVDKSTNGVKESMKCNEPIAAASSVCSGNSAERASNDVTKNSKRKSRDVEDSEWQSHDDEEEESLGTKPKSASRNGSGSKRSRAAEVHNLSERRRRDRINEKMRALQELIPNCNKVDKASMLDEAIEYLKTLQLQVQIMSMGAGLCMPPMMFPTGMQHMPHLSPMGMSYGMGMEMNGGPHMFPFTPTTTQGMPVLLPQTPMPGIPIIYPAAAAVRQVDVPDVGPCSKDPMTPSQSQDANKSLNQSTSVDTKDQLFEGGGGVD